MDIQDPPLVLLDDDPREEREVPSECDHPDPSLPKEREEFLTGLARWPTTDWDDDPLDTRCTGPIQGADPGPISHD